MKAKHTFLFAAVQFPPLLAAGIASLLPNTAFAQTPPLDFGDAPSPYPTTLRENGAYHMIAGPKLGSLVDSERDGQPSAAADGDDKNPVGAANDEDGVVFLTPLSLGKEAQVQITASGNFDRAMIDAWIDFDANGSWAESGEQIFISKSVTPGANVLSFTVPENAKIGTTFARFRISINGKLSFKGEANNGEVEDYAVTISQPLYDFGDAPYKYPTTLADNGARHAVTNNFCLGTAIDAEPDGQPDANALGDDNNPPGVKDDEDGVTFLTPLESGKTASIQVYLTAPGAAAPGRGYLDAWIDFNLNQSWADAGEQICTNYLIYAGNNVISFTVPSS
ncbi:MAG: GEVED domain-containing protein, partial [Verrucomicrobiia bacterium]